MSLQHRIGPRAMPTGGEKVLKRKASYIERDIKPGFHHRQRIRPPDTSASIPGTIPTAAGYNEAQMLLDEVASSMRPYKRPKLEPVEISLTNASFIPNHSYQSLITLFSSLFAAASQLHLLGHPPQGPLHPSQHHY